MSDDMPEIPTDTLAETENYIVWAADEPDEEITYHLELGPVTVHFFQEEWDEFLVKIRAAFNDPDAPSDDADGDIEVQFTWGALVLAEDEWKEFEQLIEQIES
ncbi:MAG: hypothetical protein JW966_03755 [Anaerolineae bacterium]|nr:hypothetical protein [Anaerolineae bacterium]